MMQFLPRAGISRTASSIASQTAGRPSAQGWKWNWLVHRGKAEQTILLNAGTAYIRTPKMARLEAALFVAEGALAAKKLAQIATLADAREATSLIEQLNAAYDSEKSAFRIERVAAGYQLLTLSSLSPWLDRVHHRQARLKLSPPMMETLAIIAYRQPCTRADVESVRGVQSAEIIKQLMEKNLVRVTGEDQSLGRPYLYGTTRLFLETFGLTKLEEMPMSEHLRRSLSDAKETGTQTPDAPDESAAA
ncbi:SMC-Scp complex subunit ScpB [Planctomicrobium sp. SH661]|uniref:SMC-Scp complex subunit ScpB n=1 Tax=Planctomicrobium sp. SH661 TaxID=3448124 RepID=UPI003F5B63BF